MTALYLLTIYIFVHILFEAIVDLITVDVVIGRERGVLFFLFASGIGYLFKFENIDSFSAKKLPTDEDVDFY